VLGLAALVGKESGTKLVLPATNELIWGAVSFLLFLLVLWRAGVWRRLGEAMDERTRRIRTDLEEAEKARREAEETLESSRRRLQEAREEARQILEEARRNAEQVRAELIARAERDADAVRARAEEEIQAELGRAKAELRREVGSLAVQVATRVVGESLDGDRQLRLVDQYIDELSEMSGNGNGQRGAS
jgi:F-type H+-transporting ATPase subunit b